MVELPSYVHEDLNSKRRQDLESPEIEQICTCLELQQHRCASFLLSCLYRPPNTNADFFEYLTQLVECISLEAKEIHFVGDFNIDLLQRDNSSSRRLKHLMENFGLHQMIDKPTRIAEQSKTVLDHHYRCTHTEHVMFTSVPSFGLSDHNPTILVRKQNVNLRRKKNGKHEWIFFRSLKKVDTDALTADLNKIPWSILDVYSNDPDEMLHTWNKLVLDVVDTHAPVKQKRVKTSATPSWLTNEILEAIKNCAPSLKRNWSVVESQGIPTTRQERRLYTR